VKGASLHGVIFMMYKESMNLLTPTYKVGEFSSPSNITTKYFDDHQVNINTFHQHPEKYTKVEKKCQYRHC
jgi:hypothetical protein